MNRPTTTRNDSRPSARYLAAVTTAVLAGGVLAGLLGVLVMNYRQAVAGDPLCAPELGAKLRELSNAPDNLAARAEYRRLDAELRREFFMRQRLTQTAPPIAILLAAVLAGAVHLARVWRPARAAWLPRSEPTGSLPAGRRARWAVGLTVLAMAAGLAVVLAGRMPPAIPPPSAPPQYATLADLADRWCRFRGPDGLGISPTADVPVSWDVPAGRNLAWKAPVPLPGKSSPVLWGDKLFLTGATAQQREVYCFSAADGRLLWRYDVRDVPGSPARPPSQVADDTGYAAPTACIDGYRVYALFANMDLVCLTLDGRRLWARNLGEVNNHYGHASSLALAGERRADRLIAQVDQAIASDARSRLIAMDPAGGELLWQARRAVDMSWSSPITVATQRGRQIIASANPLVAAYNPADGGELWRAAVMNGEIGASPAYSAAMKRVIVSNEPGPTTALPVDAAGDVTANALWNNEEVRAPDAASPALSRDGRRVFLAAGDTVTCLDAADGTKLWDHEFENESFFASPVVVGDRIYLPGRSGAMYIFPATGGFELQAVCPLGERSDTTPAFAPGRVFLRGQTGLYCIAEKTP